MGMQYVDADGVMRYPLMGCYGIGIGRLAASVCETCHDEHGPIWPMSIAPWQVHLIAIRSDIAAVKEHADTLYAHLQKSGIETLYDDRVVSAGVMLSDADLLGVPVRIIISPRNLKENCCEVSARDKSFSYKVPMASTAKKTEEIIHSLLYDEHS